jgi:hypothetical protein
MLSPNRSSAIVVANFRAPSNVTCFSHRMGRTGRLPVSDGGGGRRTAAAPPGLLLWLLLFPPLGDKYPDVAADEISCRWASCRRCGASLRETAPSNARTWSSDAAAMPGPPSLLSKT